MRPLVSVAGHALPDPSKYNGTVSTFVNAGRNTEGVTIGAVIRENVGKVEMVWNYLPIEKWAEICALFDGSRGGAFYNHVDFFCLDLASWTTREMYVSDRKAGVPLRQKDGSVKGLTGCSLNLIEV